MLDTNVEHDIDFGEIARKICEQLHDQAAQDVLLLSVGEILDYTDYFIICHSLSGPHLKALARFLDNLTSELKIRVIHTDGIRGFRWIIFDMGALIVHLFSQEAREFYGLERLWSDAPRQTYSLSKGDLRPD